MTAVRAGHASIAEGALAVAAAVAAAAVFCLRVETGGRPLSVVEVVPPAPTPAPATDKSWWEPISRIWYQRLRVIIIEEEAGERRGGAARFPTRL